MYYEQVHSWKLLTNQSILSNLEPTDDDEIKYSNVHKILCDNI